MTQDIIVTILIAAALINVFYQVVKLIMRKKDDIPACGGCGQCELKKSMISQKH